MRSQVFVAVLALSLGAASAPSASAASRARPYDFDGNGHPDLAVGAPGLQVKNGQDVGGVVVLPASKRGLSSTEKVITQSSRGVPGASEPGDRFGSTMASGDFDRDGYADLAVGHPSESSTTVEHVGAVTVIYGSSRGLNTRRALRLPTPSNAAAETNFGAALAAGDFDRDGYVDLAVGAPGDAPGPRDEMFQPSGTVTLVRGGRSGLSRANPTVLRHNADPNNGDMRFGARLAAADLDLDGRIDLVVASSGLPDRGDDPYPGTISYCLGRSGGPTGCSPLLRSTDFTNPATLAVGNLLGAARPEIVMGTLNPSLQNDGASGVLVVELVSGSPLRPAASQVLRSESGLSGPTDSTAFGRSLTLGDINRDGFDDLVVGAPRERDSRGRINVIYGAASGLRTTGNPAYRQDTPGIPGASEPGDAFGSAVTLLDHNGDGRLDLTVGALGENSSGAITTLPSQGTEFATKRAKMVTLRSLGHAERGNADFGAVLGR